MTKARHAKLKAEQDERIKQRLLAGESVDHIMTVEGAVSSTVNAVKRKLGIKGKGKTPKEPHGLTQKSDKIRGFLGYRLTDQLKDKHWMEVAAATGINRNEQTVAGRNPFLHDWKLSEIERLADLLGMPLHELLLKAMQPSTVGFGNKKEREEWNRTLGRYTIGS